MAKLVPEAQEYVAAFNQLPDFTTMDPIDVRAILDQAKNLEMELASVASVKDRDISVSPSDYIRLRIFTPEGNGPFPIIIYYHGGAGF